MFYNAKTPSDVLSLYKFRSDCDSGLTVINNTCLNASLINSGEMVKISLLSIVCYLVCLLIVFD